MEIIERNIGDGKYYKWKSLKVENNEDNKNNEY